MEIAFARRRVFAVGIGVILGVLAMPLSGQEYRFICENRGVGLSVVDVLQATGDHNTFLDLFSRYDPEGFAILSDAELADKTVWAPTDAAFLAMSDSLSSLSDEEVKAILGYHISPPRRTPGGSYPIVTPEFLIDAERMNHRTRTGVLTESDQRTQTTVTDGVLMIEDAQIMGTAWCTEFGSVFSIDAVIMNVATPSVLVRALNRIVRILLYDDIRFVIYSTVGAVLIGTVVALLAGKRTRRKKEDKTR